MRDCGGGNNADHPFVIIRSDRPFSTDKNYQTTAEITFGNGSLFQHEPVIPTLLQMSELVSKAIKDFERLILSTGA